MFSEPKIKIFPGDSAVMLGQKIGIEALAILIFLRQFAAKINKHGYVYLTEKSL